MLAEAISAIRVGDLLQTQVARLSDLSRNNARVLAAAWESIPEENRIDLVRRFDELSEERVELNFGAPSGSRSMTDRPSSASSPSRGCGKTNRANCWTGCETFCRTTNPRMSAHKRQPHLNGSPAKQ